MSQDNEHEIAFAAWAESFETTPPIYSLARALAVDPSEVHPASRAFLRELDPDASLAQAADDFATSYRAYLGFQDLLDLAVNASPLEHRHYYYYESLGCLREIGHCLLSGNFLAVLTLQRPFLELAVFHAYWRGREDEFKLFYKWLSTGGGKPPFKNALTELFRHLDTLESVGQARARRLSDDLYAVYTDACAYNHVAHIRDSYVALNAGNRRATHGAASVALAAATLCLRQVLFLFGLTYPMVFFPRRVEQKFGIGGPIGLFASYETAVLYRAAIGDANADELQNGLSAHPSVVSLLEWFDAQPDASPELIENTWQQHLALSPMEQPPSDLRGRMVLARTTWRSLGWVFNYLNLPSTLDSGPEGQGEPSDENPMIW